MGRAAGSRVAPRVVPPGGDRAVLEALGDDIDAWERFAASLATNGGATAWLRLGDLLDAAATGGPWPQPPAGR
ncbi:hypothetical protein [Streptomyces sp. URMC 129]|uniref:hypothetical protein n=1 Tax=Streptomyces sp. URMC 129 TaxID=3423407 RepID=UPI003F1B0F2C